MLKQNRLQNTLIIEKEDFIKSKNKNLKTHYLDIVISKRIQKKLQ